jgi:hypothetical protein
MCTRKRMQPKVLTRESSLCQQRQVHLALAGCALTTIYRPPSSTSASRAARQTQQVPARSYADGHLPLYIAGCSSTRGCCALSCEPVLALGIWHLHLRRPPAMTIPALPLSSWHTLAGKPVENMHLMREHGSPCVGVVLSGSLQVCGAAGRHKYLVVVSVHKDSRYVLFKHAATHDLHF